jgi:hypothetical protein
MSLTAFALAIAQHHTPNPVSSHGTVNIVLANGNGMVAVTDSRLSYHHQIVGEGQKLFILDDHTVCTIAGFYNDPGPGFGYQHPAAQAVPEILNAIIQNNQTLKGASLQIKLRIVLGALQGGLEFVSTLEKRMGAPVSQQPSQVTVAGYDADGILKIYRVDLTPSSDSEGNIAYVADSWPPLLVEKKLVHSTAGMDDLAFSALWNPQPYASGDELLAHLAHSLVVDGGSTLTVDDLRHISEDLVEKTARKYPIEVGGPHQIAILVNGKVQTTNQPVTPPSYLQERRQLFTVSNSALDGGGYYAVAAGVSDAVIKVSPGALLLYLDSDLSRLSAQPLDNSLYFHTRISNSTLTYSGSRVVAFDSTNTLINCRLVLAAGVQRNNPFVTQLATDFPSLTIQTGP